MYLQAISPYFAWMFRFIKFYNGFLTISDRFDLYFRQDWNSPYFWSVNLVYCPNRSLSFECSSYHRKKKKYSLIDKQKSAFATSSLNLCNWMYWTYWDASFRRSVAILWHHLVIGTRNCMCRACLLLDATTNASYIKKTVK